MSLSHSVAAPNATRRTLRAAFLSPVMAALARYGLIVRGVIYIVPGVLALRLAFGTHGAATTPADAVRLIGRQPFGGILMLAVAIGLAGYTLWGINRAVFDRLHRGHSFKGIVKRLGYLTSALAYAGLLVVALRLLAGAAAHDSQSQNWAKGILANPFGPWLLGVIALGWIAGGGIGEIVHGARAGFAADLDMERMSSAERRFAMGLGRFGIVARGVVFGVIGVLLIIAAIHADSRDTGMDDALLALAHQPFGRILLAAAAVGLIAFGTFSMLCSRWMRMPAPQP